MQQAHIDPTLDAIVLRISQQDAIYIRRRRLVDGATAHADSFAQDVVKSLCEEFGEPTLAAFVEHVFARKAELPRLVLLTAGLLAIAMKRWSESEALGREVVSRDHHDLLAQRVIDAALEQSVSLETETDRWLRTRTCNAPFQEMESRTNGEVHFCCSAWQPVPIGRLDTPGEDGFWNSERAQEIRRSVLDGDFSHCSRWHCPAIAGRRLPARNSEEPRRSTRALAGPDRVILSHDRSCNISCPSCRTGLINLPHAETERLNLIFEKHLLPLVNAASKIKVTGSGDPFGSRHFRSILKRLTATGERRRRIQLHTNGLLANERAWNELDLWGNVSSVWVSIDAACAETYSVLRRGGNFDVLMTNLRFLGDLCLRGEIDTLRLDFVVQHANYKEMSDFVDLAQEVGAKGVYFLRLRNWGHVQPNDFRLQDICSADHPEHEILLEILANKKFASETVHLGSMTPLALKARRMAGHT